ncbi:DUF4835 family protein [Dysgonomonas sp. 521]|uniref:type IX secretion system protein PorD n=1 Tax=Dysgonomonas sp. 521 TaxID=2302932 RepID=UPI0013D0B699|nr:DUF4835 family protein [Dysgonomonas sp. 521]NDV95212.1 DUF4835 family protein [Dysgonomonas sp. 521]
MIRLIIFILSMTIFPMAIQAQELNAKLTINTRKIPAANQSMFSTMENSINQMLSTQWTNATFNRNERIDCTISIAINEMPTENSFTAEIQITSRRPVYNSSYITTLLNFRDTKFEFNYLQGESLDVNSLSLNSNLVAVISFYAYVVIGLDFDSFSPNGGAPYFAKAMEIANMAQSLNTKGWEPFSGKNDNRYDLAVALTDESSKTFHSFWYNYHRNGLDEMAANPSRGRIRIIEALPDLQKLYEARPSSPLLSIISETKLSEIVSVCSQATAEEKQSIKKQLNQIFPTKGSTINNLK